MKDTEFKDCDLQSSWIEGVEGDPTFEDCDLSNSTIKDIDFDFQGAEELGCDLDGITDGDCPH